MPTLRQEQREIEVDREGERQREMGGEKDWEEWLEREREKQPVPSRSSAQWEAPLASGKNIIYFYTTAKRVPTCLDFPNLFGYCAAYLNFLTWHQLYLAQPLSLSLSHFIITKPDTLQRDCSHVFTHWKINYRIMSLTNRFLHKNILFFPPFAFLIFEEDPPLCGWQGSTDSISLKEHSKLEWSAVGEYM